MAHAIAKRGRLGIAGRIPTARAPVPHQPRIVSLVTRPHVFHIGPMGKNATSWDTEADLREQLLNGIILYNYGILGLVVKSLHHLKNKNHNRLNMFWKYIYSTLCRAIIFH